MPPRSVWLAIMDPLGGFSSISGRAISARPKTSEFFEVFQFFQNDLILITGP
jgi:hypothetical protein